MPAARVVLTEHNAARADQASTSLMTPDVGSQVRARGTSRDPRITPQVGDVVRVQGKDLHVTEVAPGMVAVTVRWSSRDGHVGIGGMAAWRSMCAGAVVVKVSELAKGFRYVEVRT